MRFLRGIPGGVGALFGWRPALPGGASRVGVLARRRRVRLMVLAALALTGSIVGFMASAAASTVSCTRRALDVVAHQDDSILFMNPDVAHDISAKACVREVYVTAGQVPSSSQPEPAFWMGREKGAKAALASEAGVPSNWTVSPLTTPGGVAQLETLNGAPNISIVFLRLPAGNQEGDDYSPEYGPTLHHLWDNPSLTTATVDGNATYDRDTLIATLAQITKQFKPTVIRTQNPSGYPELADQVDEFSDHSDHHMAAQFEITAATSVGYGKRVISYLDYETQFLPANVTGSDLQTKKRAVVAYGKYDISVCSSPCTSYANLAPAYQTWIPRMYHPSSYRAGTAIIAYGSADCLGGQMFWGGGSAATASCSASGFAPEIWTYNAATKQIVGQLNVCLQSSSGGTVATAMCDATNVEQQWTVEMPEGTITDSSGNCLTVADPSTPGAVTASTCTNATGQLWGYGIRPAPLHELALANFTSRCADAVGDGSGTGTPVALYTCGYAGPQQRWRLKLNDAMIGNGNKCLTVPDPGTAGTAVQMSTCDGSADQHWAFNGSALVGRGGLCLAVGGAIADNTPLVVDVCNGGAFGQQWTMQ